MALGKRISKQSDLFISTTQIVMGPGHPFYSKLNEVLEKAGFDDYVEDLCAEYYKKGGRPGIPSGIYFRMVLIGYFEGIDSQRGAITEPTPVHASMTIIRQRLPETVSDQVFAFVLRILKQLGLLQGQTLGIDATTLEANAAMKSIVRKETGENWTEYLRGLARAEGLENPTEEDLRRMDRQRTDKKVSNQHWESPQRIRTAVSPK